jgi:outer membrane protein assembly factor BamB
MTTSQARLTRRGALLLPLAAAGCETLDNWFGDKKTPLNGDRITIGAPQKGLAVDNPAGRTVTLPAQQANAAWPQPGADPTHAPGNPALGQTLTQIWTAGIGAPGGYRRRITATPVVSDGRVYAMDCNAVVSAYDVRSGTRLWRTPTAQKTDRSTNLGGGIALAGDTAYVSTGLASVVALDAGSGRLRWRQALDMPARAAPTIVADQLYLPTLDDIVLALGRADGKKQWSYQSTPTPTSVFAPPSPAFADGLVVAGFGAGDLVCLRAVSGSVSWSDGLAAARGRTTIADFSAITGLPVIADGSVYAVGLGGLFVALDLRTGRRLWEREVASSQTPWLAGDWLYVLTPDQNLGAVHRADGTVAWVTQLPLFKNEKKKSGPITWIGPVLAGDRLILGGSSHEIASVDPRNGKLLARQKVVGAPTVTPVVADRTLFVVTENAKLLALR